MSFIMLLIAGCATKEPPFNAAASFREAEESMNENAFEKARKKYQEIQEKQSDKVYDATIMLRIADTYFGDEKYSEALVEYQSFLNYHPVHRDAAYAQYQIAMCHFNDLTTIDRDPTPAYALVREMRKLIDKYPKSGYEDQARKYIDIGNDWIADYELYVARFYYKKGSFKASAGRFEKLLRDYPGSTAEKDALYYAALARVELGEYGPARALFEALSTKYPLMKKTAQSHLNALPVP